MIRQGMWVFHSEYGIGIASALGPRRQSDKEPALSELEVEYHHVAETGETDIVRIVALADLVQARYAEIPEPRRPDRAMATRLGYA